MGERNNKEPSRNDERNITRGKNDLGRGETRFEREQGGGGAPKREVYK